METWHADSLATALVQSFPRSGIAADIWAAELQPLDHIRGEEAVRRIRRTSEHAPTIAHFHSVYGSLLGTAPAGEKCEWCDDTGLVTDTDHPRHWVGRPGTMPERHNDDGPCDCNVATWCRQCDHGKRSQQMLRRLYGTPATA